MLTSTKIETNEWDLIVYFNDGVVKKVDIRDWLKDYTQPEVKKITQDKTYFHKAVNEGAAISWPGGFAIDPDYIHDEGESVIDYKTTAKLKKTSEDFFKYIADRIDTLSKAYELVVKEITSKKIKSDVSYDYLIGRLKRAIDAFKAEMAESLKDYYHLKDRNILTLYALTHIQQKLDELKKIYASMTTKIPDSILKEKLEDNYYFHKNIKKLTAKKIMEYFETNYILHKKK